MTVKKRNFTISGTVGAAGVTMQGFPGSTPVMTDENGVYQVEVGYGWSATVKPVKAGYTFQPAQKPYVNVTSNLTREDYKPTVLTYTISGSTTPQGGVKLIGFPEEVTSDPAGRYTVTVVYGWTGTVIPEKAGFRFDPPNKSYPPVTKDSRDDYKASDLTFIISGTAGAAGVVMKGLPKDPVSGPEGAYRAEVPYKWTGTVKPMKEGVQFTPDERPYSVVTENQTNQDYSARVFTYLISGTVGMAGVVMKGLPEDPITDNNGHYSATVTHGWMGKVTPDKPGHKFDPAFKSYPKVIANHENEDYKASVIQVTISGTAGTSGVTFAGLPGDPQGDSTGAFTVKVPYGWSGSVAPKKEGWFFVPTSRDFSSLIQDQLKQDFKAQAIRIKISGSVFMPQVALSGLPGSVISGPDGTYSAEVGFNWSGTVVPRRDGYTFEPASIEYKDLQAPQPSQDYQARIMQHAIPGRIVDEAGKPLEDVAVATEPDAGSTKSDANGQFKLAVDHRWQGNLTFQKEGYAFTPPSKTFSFVLQDAPELAVAAKAKMLTITDRIVMPGAAGEEPIAGVKVTAVPPGTNPVVTDSNGKYSVKVPWNWTGLLKFEHPQFVFDPNTKDFATPVVADIDNTSPKPATPSLPETAPPVTTLPPVTTPPVTTLPPPITTPQVSAGEQAIRQQIDLLRQEQATSQAQIAADRKIGVQTPAATLQRFNDIPQLISDLVRQLNTPAAGPELTTVARGGTLPSPAIQGQGPIVPPIEGPRLLGVLDELAKKTGVTITTDPTVKDDPVGVSLPALANLPVASALQMIVTSVKPPYWYRPVDDRTFQVFRPISNSFSGTDLAQVLQDLAGMAGVSIVPDPNINGTVNVTFDNATLDEALQIVLAGKPYVVKKMPHYYLVADRSLQGRAFIDISETRRIRLNYTTAARAKALLSPVFGQYVQAEPANPRDPNDQGNTLMITAPAALMDRIVQDLLLVDRYKRQVLLDARVVVMERGDLLNLGTEWGWPTMKVGAFKNGVGGADGVTTSGWPFGVQLGYSPDRTFTDSLMMTLNLLQENSQADIIANPKVVAQDGRRATMGVVQEEWFMMTTPQTGDSFFSRAELQKIESGTVLTITPYIGDNNDIMLEMAVEVSDSIPKARGSDLPLVTRRRAQNSVTVKDGGTVAVGGLTENRSKSSDKRVPLFSQVPLVGELFKNRNKDKASREIAVFVTAHLVSERGQAAASPSAPGDVSATNNQPAGDDFRRGISDVLANGGR
jgi:hypothetical protein